MTDPDPTFEESLCELDGILRELEDGGTTLDAALARYERGVGLLRRCHAQLNAAEQRIQQLGGLTADGGPDLKPFAHAASTDKPKAVRRPRPEANGGMFG